MPVQPLLPLEQSSSQLLALLLEPEVVLVSFQLAVCHELDQMLLVAVLLALELALLSGQQVLSLLALPAKIN